MKKISHKNSKIQYLLFCFFISSILAWVLEMFYSIIFRKKFVTPGVLYGPWCPIYGVTFIFLLLLINKKEKRIQNFFKIFIMAVIIEYFSSYISDKVFGRVIWNYSNYLFNIEGRVCLHMSLLFSMMGYFIMYYVEPLFKKIYNVLSSEIVIFNIELLILFIFDIILKIMIGI